MSFPQSKLEDWARQMGETHGEWVGEVIREAYEAGYAEAYPHAAKHTVEKVLEIIKREMDGASSEIIRNILTKEKWK